MITTNDIIKLKTVFATKDDLKRFATKKDLDNRTNVIIKEIKTVIEIIGEFTIKSKGQEEILDTHERRLDKLEDKVYSPN